MRTPGKSTCPYHKISCLHSLQVCNLADCIKVATDFVSLESVDRCEMLTAEFRDENKNVTWKEDVLQLRTMMMYAWRSTCQLRMLWHNTSERLEDSWGPKSRLGATTPKGRAPLREVFVVNRLIGL
jgi:hypothetical protein